ncbi:MAG: putative aminohydrolase SsnA [Pseudomonadota bacterium]
MPGDIIIRNATIFTGSDVIDGGTIVIRGGEIIECSADAAVEESAGDDVIDASGRLVTPGFTIGHTHVYSALARGIMLGGEPAHNFIEILEKLWWRLDSRLTPEQVELSSFLYGSSCLKSGVTTIFDHHASFGRISGSLDVLAGALAKIGLRACLCFAVSDRGGEKKTREAIEENVDFIRRTAGGGPMLNAMFGLHASFTLSDSTLKTCAASADPDKTGFHIHAAEDKADQDATVNQYGKRVIERLGEAGILGEKTILAHCIWLEDREIDILTKSGSTVAYNPQSNMNNAVGALRAGRMLERGVKVVLGTDGFTGNIFREALVGQILQNHLEKDPAAGWNVLPRMVLAGNDLMVQTFFERSNAALVEGRRSDVVLWDYDPPTPVLGENFWGHAVFGLLDCRADVVVVEGKVVLRGGACGGIDEDDMMKECRGAARALWEDMR